jgi:uncharacterized membrane protein YhaH (DUF805 family)
MNSVSMIEIIYVLILIVLLLITLSTHLYLKVRRLSNRPKSREVQDFMADLLSGNAVVQMRLINAEDLVLRSPNR